jgi:hypothetical protein
MKKALLVIIATALIFGCKNKNPAQNIEEASPPTDTSIGGAGLPTIPAPARLVFIPSASDLEAFLAVFPEITSFPYEIEDEPPIGYPSLVKSDRSPDPDLAAGILNWDPPPDQWRPVNWRWDIEQEVESPSPEDSDIESSEEEAPLGDAGYEGEWEHGFYAFGRMAQPNFHILIAAYSEAFSYPYSDPWIKEEYEYRLITIAPDGRFIDSLELCSSRLVETYHVGTDIGNKNTDSMEGSAVIESDLSLRVEERSSWEGGVETVIRKYTIDEAGSIHEVEEADQAQDQGD